MKKLFTLFLVLMTTLAIGAADFQSGDLYYNITSSTSPYTVEVTYKSMRSNYSNTTLSIPASVINNGITYAVTRIGSKAFAGCKSLTSVTISASVVDIAGDAFLNAALYKDEANWTDGILYIDNCLISAKTSLSGAYNIKEGTRVIAGQAFKSCESLTAIHIPNSVVGIGNAAFSSCSALTSITIPSHVTSIKEYTFYKCHALQNISIPSTITSIGERAFYECNALSELTIPATVKSMGKAAFYNCNQLQSPITIPDGITSIEDSLFSHCWSIPSLTLPNSVTTIGDYAFENCGELKSITIPKSVTSIGGQAFNLCYSLAQIVVEEGNPIYDSRNNCNAIIETATNTLLQGSKNTVIPSTVTTIAPYAFSFGATPNHLVIPKSVTNIDYRSFYMCYNLAKIEVESGNPVFDSRDNCNAIVETTNHRLLLGCANTVIPSSIRHIGEYAFWSCTNLTSITIPDGLESIGEYAFSNCTKLTSITLPNSLTDIKIFAFYQCSSLKSVVIPDNVKNIEGGAFNFCRTLQSLTIGSGVQTIGSNAFDYCYDLKTVICKLVKVPTKAEAYSGIYFNGIAHADATLYVPAESLEDYRSTYPWNKFGTILPLDQAPSGVEDIPTTEINGPTRSKVMHNGQVLIYHDGKTYNMLGSEIQ